MTLSYGIFSLASPISKGVLFGFADFLFSTTAQKVLMLAGIKFKEDLEVGDISPDKRLDMDFHNFVIKYPILEETVFRGILQPYLSGKLPLFFPKLKSIPSVMGIPLANLVSSVALGVIFGSIHYLNYTSGGIYVALIASISGSFYGLIKEKFGLASSISAHIIHNFMVGWLDKNYPTFLES